MEELQQKIGYKFKNVRLLQEALTHSSANADYCYERLEFLGDAVLELIVSNFLYKSLKKHSEGKLTKLRARLVCEDALYNYALKIGLGEKMRLGKGEEVSGGRNRKSILADAFEALIAAIYLDDGFKKAEAFVLPFMPEIEVLKSGKMIAGSDYKTALQELVQTNPNATLVYEAAGETGEAHNKTFTVNVLINGKVEGSGSGSSKKEAEQKAAHAALIKKGYS